VLHAYDHAPPSDPIVKEEMEEAQREVANGRKHNHALEQEIDQLYATLAEHESTITQLRSELASHHAQLHAAFHSLSSAQSRQSAQLGIVLLDVMREIKQRKEEFNAVERRRVEEENKLKQMLDERNETQQLRDRNDELDARCHAQQQLIHPLQVSHTHATHVMEEEFRTMTMKKRVTTDDALSTGSSMMQPPAQTGEPSHPIFMASHSPSTLLPLCPSSLRALAPSALSSMDVATIDASSRPSDDPPG